MATTNFKEKQRYDNKLVLIMLAVIGMVAIGKAIHLLFQPSPDWMGVAFLSLFGLMAGGAIWWLLQLRLTVVISARKVAFKLFPLHGKKRSIPWEEIAQWEIVKTPEVAQWSGGNITFNHEKRFSLTGRNGLAIETKDGELFFIGCKNVDRLEKMLNQFQQT